MSLYHTATHQRGLVWLCPRQSDSDTWRQVTSVVLCTFLELPPALPQRNPGPPRPGVATPGPPGRFVSSLPSPPYEATASGLFRSGIQCLVMASGGTGVFNIIVSGLRPAGREQHRS